MQILDRTLTEVTGAIAFGHPLGCTGARQVSTLFTELKRTGKKIGVTSMCVVSAVTIAFPLFSEPTLTSASRALAWVWLLYGLQNEADNVRGCRRVMF